MNLPTLLGIFLVTGGSTTLGSLPVVFHRYFKQAHWNWWESFGGGVMVSASFFSLFLPALKMIHTNQESYLPFIQGLLLGVTFIFGLAFIIKKWTENVSHQKAFLFVFVMGLHNIPEGLAVGVDVAALGWQESLPLTVAIFIQNLPEGLVTSLSFLISGFSLKKAFFANGVTAIIETMSGILGYSLVSSSLELAFLFSFAGACMISVVTREVLRKLWGADSAGFSYSGFGVGLGVCGLLDLLL